MITERDINILKIVNQFGFSSSSIIKECLFNDGPGRSPIVRARRRILKLQKHGLLKKQKNILSTEDIFTLSSIGKDLLYGSNAAPLKIQPQINWGEFNHDLEVQKIYLHFRSLGYKKFYSERKAKECSLFNDLVPDLVMIRKDMKALMIEVELTRKSFKRMEDKMNQYSTNPYAMKILYICKADNIQKALEKTKSKFPELRQKLWVMTLDDFYSEKSKSTLLNLMGEEIA